MLSYQLRDIQAHVVFYMNRVFACSTVTAIVDSFRMAAAFYILYEDLLLRTCSSTSMAPISVCDLSKQIATLENSSG